jgi:hypothetical protein
MTSFTVALFALTLAVAGCAGSSQSSGGGATAGPPAASEQAKQLPGQYTCGFESRGETLGDASCGIQPEGANLRLDMSGGKHQLRGTLTATDAGFKFVGDYTCSDGDSCKEAVETEFFQQEKGKYQGVVTLQTGTLLSVTLNKL